MNNYIEKIQKKYQAKIKNITFQGMTMDRPYGMFTIYLTNGDYFTATSLSMAKQILKDMDQKNKL